MLALGSVPHYFGVEGAAEHAFPLRWMDDAIPLRHHVLTCFEAATATRRSGAASAASSPSRWWAAGRRAWSSPVPWPSSSTARCCRDYPGLDAEEISVVLLEATDRLLGDDAATRWARYAVDRLARRRVRVRTGVRVEAVRPDAVVLAGGERIPTETVVWTAGIQGDPAVRGVGTARWPGEGGFRWTSTSRWRATRRST